MIIANSKVYSDDGKHFIAIPYSGRRYSRRLDRKGEPCIEAEEEKMAEGQYYYPSTLVSEKPLLLTKRELFNRKYGKSVAVIGKELRNASFGRKSTGIFREMYSEMNPYFDSESECKDFVRANMERVVRNYITRKVRINRKLYLGDFNYFCTITYDDSKHNEETFVFKLMKLLQNFATRRGWRYMAVWERGGETNRLHLHALLHVPEGQMPGILFEKRDYSLRKHRMQESVQNSFFLKRFGRCDFQQIRTSRDSKDCLQYILKYIEKTNERVIFSRHLPSFYLCDVDSEDVITSCGVGDRKLILFDDFLCRYNGNIYGRANDRNALRSLPPVY